MTKENTLSVEDICSIIDACSSNGVSSFNYGGLEVSFKDRKEHVENIIIPSNFHGPESIQNDITIVDEIKEDLDPEYNKDLERDLKAIELENALLENPELAEAVELMSEEELEAFMKNLMGEKDYERS